MEGDAGASGLGGWKGGAPSPEKPTVGDRGVSGLGFGVLALRWLSREQQFEVYLWSCQNTDAILKSTTLDEVTGEWARSRRGEGEEEEPAGQPRGGAVGQEHTRGFWEPGGRERRSGAHGPISGWRLPFSSAPPTKGLLG